MDSVSCPVIGRVSIKVHHEVWGHLQSGCGREVFGNNWSKRDLTGSERNDSLFFVAVKLSGHLEGVEGWVVTNSSAINLELSQVVAIDDLMRIEISWSSRRRSSSVTNWCMVNSWILCSHIFTEESWLLRVVFIRDNQELISYHIWEVSGSKVAIHNMIKTFSREFRWTKHKNKFWDSSTDKSTYNHQNDEDDPLLWLVLVVFLFSK